MTKQSALVSPWPSPVSTPSRRRPRAAPPAADSLATAIQKPAEVLAAAAADAANGMLGGAKLGLLVAAAGLCDALEAVDAEFARRYGAQAAGGPDSAAARLSPLSGMRIEDGRG